MQHAGPAISCYPLLNDNRLQSQISHVILIPDSIGAFREDMPDPLGMSITARSYDHPSTCGGSRRALTIVKGHVC